MTAAILLHVSAQGIRPLWLDEASTYWTTRGDWLAILNQVGTDGSPPLYFLIVKAFTAVFGDSEFALRLPSLVAATTLIPALYVLGRRMGGARTGLFAAALAAGSPLVHYYAVEARPYAVLSIETAAVAIACFRAVESPQDGRRWLVLWLAEVMELSTHIYAAFLLASLPLVAALLASPRARATSAGRAALTTLGAFAMCVPWLRTSLAVAHAGVGDWIVPLWNELPPSMAIIRSLSVFGFGAEYPAYLWLPQNAPNVGAWSVGLTLGVLAMAVLGSRKERIVRGTAALLLLPLFAAWAYSWVSIPLYLPGRYDTIVLPIFLVLFAVGIDRAWRWKPLAGATAGLIVLVLAAATLSSTLDPSRVSISLDVTAGRRLARVAAPGDRVVATALRQQVTWYYAAQAGFRGTIETFPSEVGEHPGWESPVRMLADPARLQRDGERLTRELSEAAAHGHRIWLLPTAPGPVNDFLLPQLLDLMEPDSQLTFKDAGLVGLRLR
jgi:mannosyltransferase